MRKALILRTKSNHFCIIWTKWKGDTAMKKQLTYQFINPNSEEETVKALINIFIAANRKKIEAAISEYNHVNCNTNDN